MSSLHLRDGIGQAVMTIEIPGDEGPALCIFGFQWDVLTAPDDVAQSIFDDFGAELLPRCTSNTVLIGCRVVINDAGTMREGVTSGSVAGGGTTASAPPQVSYLFSKRTGIAGPEFRGRMYLPGVNETNVDEAGNLSGSVVTGNQTAADDFLALLLANDHPMVLLHTDPGVPENTVTNLVAQTKVATQRRRLR